MPDNPARWDDLKAMGFDDADEAQQGQPPIAALQSDAGVHGRLRARDAIAARALEFLILTNVRTDAVLKATWDQFDLDQALWTVPLANLKDRKHRKEAFRVPLSPSAVEIVREMERARVSRFVFPGQAQASPFQHGAS